MVLTCKVITAPIQTTLITTISQPAETSTLTQELVATAHVIILLMPTTMVQDVPSIKAQEVVNSTITTTEHARTFPNADSDSRFSE